MDLEEAIGVVNLFVWRDERRQNFEDALQLVLKEARAAQESKEILLAAMPALRQSYKCRDAEDLPYKGTAERFLRKREHRTTVHSYNVYSAAMSALGLN